MIIIYTVYTCLYIDYLWLFHVIYVQFLRPTPRLICLPEVKTELTSTRTLDPVSSSPKIDVVSDILSMLQLVFILVVL
jgi:hypothetical protein